MPNGKPPPDDMNKHVCAYCGNPASGHWAIERDGFGEGPEVDLCEFCAGNDPRAPSLQDIWERIANPDPMIYEMKVANGQITFPEDEHTSHSHNESTD